MLTKLRAIWRFSIFILTAMLLILFLMIVSIFRGRDETFHLKMRRRWINMIFPFMGVDLDFTNPYTELPASAIYVQNHKSYFDPAPVLKFFDAMPVSKAEVSSWFFIGYAAAYTGVIYVKREDRESRRNTVKAMAEQLDLGQNVLIYPEGTTTASAKTLMFRLGAFRLACEKGVPIIPMAIEYGSDADCWVNDEFFLTHFMRCFGKKKVHVKMSIGAPMYGESPEQLLEEVQAWVDGEILRLRREFVEEGIRQDMGSTDNNATQPKKQTI